MDSESYYVGVCIGGVMGVFTSALIFKHTIKQLNQIVTRHNELVTLTNELTEWIAKTLQSQELTPQEWTKQYNERLTFLGQVING